jgi:hypothetical protein
MNEVPVKVLPPADMQAGTILLIGTYALEVVPVSGRGGMFVDFTDENGKVCRVYVRNFNKLPQGIIERKRW